MSKSYTVAEIDFLKNQAKSLSIPEIIDGLEEISGIRHTNAAVRSKLWHIKAPYKKKKKTWTVVEIEHFRTLSKNHDTDELAKIYKVHRTTIFKWGKKWGVKPKSKKPQPRPIQVTKYLPNSNIDWLYSEKERIERTGATCWLETTTRGIALWRLKEEEVIPDRQKWEGV